MGWCFLRSRLCSDDPEEEDGAKGEQNKKRKSDDIDEQEGKDDEKSAEEKADAPITGI